MNCHKTAGGRTIFSGFWGRKVAGVWFFDNECGCGHRDSQSHPPHHRRKSWFFRDEAALCGPSVEVGQKRIREIHHEAGVQWVGSRKEVPDRVEEHIALPGIRNSARRAMRAYGLTGGSSVHFAPISDFYDEDAQCAVFDTADNPVVANAVLPEFARC